MSTIICYVVNLRLSKSIRIQELSFSIHHQVHHANELLIKVVSVVSGDDLISGSPSDPTITASVDLDVTRPNLKVFDIRLQTNDFCDSFNKQRYNQ